MGTTHFINAVVRREGLAKVSVLRLCGPATVALPPFSDMPSELCCVMGCTYHMLSGNAAVISIFFYALSFLLTFLHRMDPLKESSAK